MKSIVTTAVLGALIAEFGLTGFNPDPESVASESQQQATAVVEQILPQVQNSKFLVERCLAPKFLVTSMKVCGVLVTGYASYHLLA